MHGTLPTLGGGRNVRSASATDQTDSDDANDWFVTPIAQLLPKDAGFALHLITGFEDRTCYRYAEGSRKVPGYFLLMLLASKQGEAFMRAFMAGRDVSWWQDMERAKVCADAFERARVQMG